MEFYHGGTSERDAADTARNGAGVLDSKGDIKQCAPTGFRIMTPSIDGVGAVRIRYPIFPVHSEGSTVGMEIEVRAAQRSIGLRGFFFFFFRGGGVNEKWMARYTYVIRFFPAILQHGFRRLVPESIREH